MNPSSSGHTVRRQRKNQLTLKVENQVVEVLTWGAWSPTIALAPEPPVLGTPERSASKRVPSFVTAAKSVLH